MTRASRKRDAFFRLIPFPAGLADEGGNFLRNSLRIRSTLFRHGTARAFLIASLIFFLSVFSAYVYFNNYVEIDFPPSNPTFDNLDPDYLLINPESRPLTLVQAAFSFIFETCPLLVSLPLSSEISPLGQRPVALRC